MRTIDLPAAAIAELTWLPESAVAITTSPFSFRHQVHAFNGQRRRAGIKIAPRTPALAKAWHATLLKLNGAEGTFFLSDTVGQNPTLARGTPVINGAGQTGKELITDGWTGLATVLEAGEWVSIGNELHQVLEQVTADSGGAATLQLWPKITKAFPDNHAIEADAPRGVFRLAEFPSLQWSRNRLLEGVNLNAVEVRPWRTRENFKVGNFVASSSQRLEAADSTDWDFGTGAFTVSCFAKWNGLNASLPNSTPVARGPVASSGWMLREANGVSNAVQFYIGGSSLVQVSGLTPGQWYHHVVTRSGTTLSHYVNAADPVTATNSTNVSDSTVLQIGCSEANANRYMDGQVDCVGIWKGRALSAVEVAKLFNRGAGYTYAGLPADLLTSLVAYWDFDDELGSLVDPVGTHTLTNFGATFVDFAE